MGSDHSIRRAFTLVELLVVIGIIAALIAILVPCLAMAQRSARKVQCMNNLRTLGVGMQVYVTDSKGILPWDGYAEGDRSVRPVGFWNDPSLWFNAAPKGGGRITYFDAQQTDAAGGPRLPKSGDKGLFVCPEASDAAPGPKDDVVEDGYFMMWGWDPDAFPAQNPQRRKTYWCYGFNTQLDGGVEDRHSDTRISIQISRIKKPSETVLLVEKLMTPNEFSPPFSSSVAQGQLSWREFTTRHEGGGFILFADNHVGYFKRKEIVNPPNLPFDYNQPGKIIWNPFGNAN